MEVNSLPQSQLQEQASMVTNKILLIFLQTYLFFILPFESAYAGLIRNRGKCQETEQLAMLVLKANLIDDYGRLSGWESTNCCEWKGVLCDNRTNHVVALDLHGPHKFPSNSLSLYPAAPLRGRINPSLMQLSHLQYLDLSLNYFNGTTFPYFIGSLTKLCHLSLSYSNFGGQIPHHIGNLSLLQFLDLSGNWLLTDTNLDWLYGSPSLRYLDLSRADLHGSTTWLQVINKLTTLRELHMSFCQLPLAGPVSLNSSSSSLVVLDLSYNSLDSSVLLGFLNMSSSLAFIDFSSNFLEGWNPDALGGLVSLSHLALHYSNLNTTPDFLGNSTSLSYLDLSHNQLQGEFPHPSKNSSSLTYLDLSSNRLSGQLTFLWDFTSLQYLSLSENRISGSFPNMSGFSDLYELHLGDNLLNGAVLEGNLRLLKLEFLDLSNNELLGILPNFSSFPSLKVLNLNQNNFSGSLSENIGYLSRMENLDVGYNGLEGDTI